MGCSNAQDGLLYTDQEIGEQLIHNYRTLCQLLLMRMDYTLSGHLHPDTRKSGRMSFRKQVMGTLILVTCVWLYTCKPAPKRPHDFSFIIKTYGSGYESQTGLFTRTYSTGPDFFTASKDTVVKVPLDLTELNDIYAAFLTYEFARYPGKFTGFPLVIPVPYTTITFRGDSQTKTCLYTDELVYPIEQIIYAKQFERLSVHIWGILLNKRAVKPLPDIWPKSSRTLIE